MLRDEVEDHLAAHRSHPGDPRSTQHRCQAVLLGETCAAVRLDRILADLRQTGTCSLKTGPFMWPEPANAVKHEA